MLRKSNCAASRKYANYWWNPMIAVLRAQTHKALRKVTRDRKKNAGNTEPLVNAYKEIRRQLKKEIARSKKTAWAEYCKILESDSWGKPYRTRVNESWNKFRQFCKIVMCHRRVTARAWKEARRRTSVTTSKRSNEGKNKEQRKTAEGDQPSILNWLRGRHEQ